MAVEVLFVPPKKSVARARSCVSGTLEKKNRTAICALICRLATNFWKNNGTRAIFFERARKRLYNGAQPEGELARTFCMEKGKNLKKSSVIQACATRGETILWLVGDRVLACVLWHVEIVFSMVLDIFVKTLHFFASSKAQNNDFWRSFWCA